jgi:hypothetical protein
MNMLLSIIAALTVAIGGSIAGCKSDPSDAKAGESDGNASTDSDSETNTAFDTSDNTNLCTELEVDAHLASDDNAKAPGTVGIVTWSYSGAIESAEIRFGLDTTYGMTAPVDLSEPNLKTLLLGMKPNRTYHYQVVVDGADGGCTSADQTIDTGPSTNLVNLNMTIHDTESHAEGFIITTQMSDFGPMAGNSVAYIMDADGEIVWWYQATVGRASRAMMSHDGKSIWLVPDGGDYGSGPMERVSMDTLETEKPSGVGASHDGTPVTDDVVAYIDYSEGDCGSVFELDKDGNTTEIFESSDYFPGLVPPECHMNAIHYYEDTGLYTVSDRGHDIFLIDRQGEVKWRLTDILSTSIFGAEQHGHQLLEDSILLFANIGGKNEESSAALEYSLADGKEILRYDSGVFSVWLGDVQRLPNGNTLVTYSIAGKMHEIDPNKNLVMEADGDSFGYSTWRPSLYGPPIN